MNYKGFLSFLSFFFISDNLSVVKNIKKKKKGDLNTCSLIFIFNCFKNKK